MPSGQELIMICLDVGPSMRHMCLDNDTVSPLDKALQFLKRLFLRKIFQDEGHQIALTIYGCDKTRNDLFTSGHTEYANIAVIKEPAVANWRLLEQIDHVVRAQPYKDLHFLDALFVAIDHANQMAAKHNSQSKTIFVLSSFAARAIGRHSADVVNEKLKNSGFALFIIVCAQGDVDSAIEVASNPSLATIKYLTCISPSNGCFPIAKVQALPLFKHRQVRLTPVKYNLALGSHFKIPVCMYVKCRPYKLGQSWKYCKATNVDMDVSMVRSYRSLPLEAGVSAKSHASLTKQMGQPVSDSDLVKAYRYGASVVPLSSVNIELTKYESPGRSLQVLGFISLSDVQPSHLVGQGSHVLSDDFSKPGATCSLAALAKACQLENKAVLARSTYSARSNPRLCLLIPMEKKSGCFAVLGVAYAEDSLPVEVYRPAQSGCHRPSKEQLAAVDCLISSMDLSNKDLFDQAPFKWSKVSNPYYQHFFKCVESKVLNADKPLPNVDEQLLSSVSPSPTMIARALPCMTTVSKLFPLDRVDQALGAKRPICETSDEKANSQVLEKKISLTNPIDHPGQALIKQERSP